MQTSIPITDLLVGDVRTVTPSFVDQNGAPIVPATAPTWENSDQSVANLAVSADGLSAVVTGVAGGETTVTITANGAKSRFLVRVSPLEVTDIVIAFS